MAARKVEAFGRPGPAESRRCRHPAELSLRGAKRGQSEDARLHLETRMPIASTQLTQMA
jgi:hypothetical protein